MSFNESKFIKAVKEDFAGNFSETEIREVLEIEDGYDKDTPVSRGASLKLNNLQFTGKKHSGDLINYNQDFDSGINVLIADNLKGKSSVFKIIKLCLTGSKSVKRDVFGWLETVNLQFTIGTKSFLVIMDLSNRILVGQLYSLSQNKESDTHNLIFECKGEENYTKSIQEFFFNQFSYYQLKWTQKDSDKSSLELREANTSWKTYFKAIFLESKDSGSLTFGGQEQKVLEMLIGLELTYAINRLSLKKDKLENKKAQSLLMASGNDSNDVLEKTETLLRKIKDIQKQIDDTDQSNQVNLLSSAFDDYEKIVERIKVLDADKAEAQKNLQKNRFQINQDQVNLLELKAKARKVQKELSQTEKNVIRLNEFLESGAFFSNLDLKHCPNCNRDVSDEPNSIESDLHECSLCHEPVSKDYSDLEIGAFETKIKEEEQSKLDLITEKQRLKVEISKFDEVLSSRDRLNEQYQEVINSQELTTLQEQLQSRIIDLSNLEKTSMQDNATRDSLVGEKAVLENELSKLTSDSNVNIDNQYDGKIQLLELAIRYLKQERLNIGKNILNSLRKLMLSEMHKFGLASISEIDITPQLSIRFSQNNDYVSFQEIAEGEQLRVKIALYLSLIQLDVTHGFGRHPRLLIIDSPGKEEADKKYIEGFSDVIKNIDSRFHDELQILIGTAERNLSGIIKDEVVIESDKFVF